MPQPSLVLGLGGTIETSFVPLRLFELLSEYEVETAVAATAGALDFITPTALHGLTGRPIYQDNRQFTPEGLPAHLAYADAALLVIVPATARLLTQCATGVVACPVTRLFAFADKDRIAVAPALHPRFDRRIYDPHLDTLRTLGVTVLGGTDGHADWASVREHILTTLRPPARTDPGSTVLLDALRRRTRSDDG